MDGKIIAFYDREIVTESEQRAHMSARSSCREKYTEATNKKSSPSAQKKIEEDKSPPESWAAGSVLEDVHNLWAD